MLNTESAGKNSTATRIANFEAAWSQVAPNIKFAGMTLSEFRTATLPFLDLLESNYNLRITLKSNVIAKAVADQAALAVTDQVVAAVKADGMFGPNSPLYRGMGFVPKSERKPRKRKEVTTPPTAG